MGRFLSVIVSFVSVMTFAQEQSAELLRRTLQSSRHPQRCYKSESLIWEQNM